MNALLNFRFAVSPKTRGRPIAVPRRGILRGLLVFLISLNLKLLAGGDLLGQTIAPPPGFAPAAEDDSAPLSPAPIFPQEPRTYSGSTSSSDTDDLSPLRESPNVVGPYPRRYPRAGTAAGRTFRDPAPVLFLDEPPLPRVWFRSEALIWWTKSSPLPVPLVTQGNPSDSQPGAIGQPGTSVLLGNQNLDLPTRGGGRFTFGLSFDAEQKWGIELSYFFLSSVTAWQGVSADGHSGSALLAFPFFNPVTGAEDSTPIALPGAFAGNAIVSLQSQLHGTEVTFLHNQLNSSGIRVDLLGGFRNVNLQENLAFTTDSPNVYPNPPAYFHTVDQFGTNNNFYGGQLGVRGSYDANWFFMNATGKLALGSMVETVSVGGGTFTNYNGPNQSAPGGYLSQPSNIGSMTREQFSVIPEMNLNFGVRLRPWMSLIAGYSFLYISNVARPGDQIDRTINPSQSPAITNNFPGTVANPARPELTIQNTSFWAQGLNLSLEIRF